MRETITREQAIEHADLAYEHAILTGMDWERGKPSGDDFARYTFWYLDHNFKRDAVKILLVLLELVPYLRSQDEGDWADALMAEYLRRYQDGRLA